MDQERKKTRLGTWVSVATKEKLDRLTERYGTQTEALAVAIDRLYVQEFGLPEIKDRPSD